MQLGAEAYDYSPVWKSGDSLCLWQKRYTSGEDLPAISFAEVIQRLANIEALCQEYTGGHSTEEYARVIAARVSNPELAPDGDIWTRLNQPPAAELMMVEISSLDPTMRAELKKFARTKQVDLPCSRVSDIIVRLRSLPRRKGCDRHPEARDDLLSRDPRSFTYVPRADSRGTLRLVQRRFYYSLRSRPDACITGRAYRTQTRKRQ